MDDKFELKCSFCGTKACSSGDESAQPQFCPMPDSKDLIQETVTIYQENKKARSLFLESSKTESAGYGQQTRIEETINFAKRLGVNKIGIAHCTGLMKEAKIAHQIIASNGFDVYSVCCKVGCIDKGELGIKDNEKLRPGQHESACNPIAQAKLLEKAGCELNVVMGLCVGHDSLFFMHSKVPTTVLIAKDRVLGHNPAAALYTSHSYYKSLKENKE